MCAQGPGLGSWHTPSDSQLLWSTLLLPNDCLLPTAWLPYCHGISVGFYNWNAPFHAEMWLVSLWKEEKTNWQVWQSLVLSLAETVGSWQQKELSAQILNLSESRCMFKRENKGPSGMKLRALGASSVGREYTLLLFTSVCLDFLCRPHSLLLQHHASTCWENVIFKGTHMDAITNFSVTIWLCIFPAELSAVGSVKCFHLPSSVAVLNYYGPVMSVAKVLEASDCFLDSDIGKSPACHIQRDNNIFLGFGVRCDTHLIIFCLFTLHLGYKRLIWHDRFLSITDILILRELLNCCWIISNRVNYIRLWNLILLKILNTFTYHFHSQNCH